MVVFSEKSWRQVLSFKTQTPTKKARIYDARHQGFDALLTYKVNTRQNVFY